MTKWNMLVDVALCENCHNCTLSIKDEYIGNNFPGYAAPQPSHGHEWIKITRRVRGSGSMVDAAYLPTMCNHCDDAPCIKATGGDGSIYKRSDGIVIVDPEKAKGRQDLVEACPYGAIWWNEELHLPQNWIFEAHLLDAGFKEPRASQACPTGALRAVKISDEARDELARDQNLEELRPDLHTKPRVLYKNLYRFTKSFIGGSVIATIGGLEECVEGATVTLQAKGAEIGRTVTDAFGDFKFDGLESGTTGYTINVAHQEYGNALVDADAGDSRYLGTIRLSGGKS